MAPDKQKINYQLVPGKAEMWSDNDNISWMVFTEGAEISREDMEELVRLATRNVLPGEQLFVLVDMRAMESITPDARDFAAGGSLAHLYTALALVANSPATRLVANFFIRFHKPPRPTKIFNSAKEGVEWLKKKMV